MQRPSCEPPSATGSERQVPSICRTAISSSATPATSPHGLAREDGDSPPVRTRPDRIHSIFELRAVFETRSDVVRFLAVVRAGSIRRAAELRCVTQPPLTRIIARLEHRFGGRLFDRLPHGVRLTALGVAVADQARRILREFDATKELTDTARSGRTGIFRVTADPVWSEAVLAPTFPRFQIDFPGIELRLETASRAVGLRRLEDGESDLHCGGIDEGERLPDFLRRGEGRYTPCGDHRPSQPNHRIRCGPD